MILFIHRVGGETWYMRIFALLPIVAPHRITCRASERDPSCVMFVSLRRLQFRAFAIPFHASQGKDDITRAVACDSRGGTTALGGCAFTFQIHARLTN